MTISKQYVQHQNTMVPRIVGAKGGKGGSTPIEAPNTLFSTDILFVTVGIGEGPVYRINPNGPQDIQIQDGSIDDLVNLDGNGLENTEKFKTLYNTGTTTQAPLDVFGQAIITPQSFSSSVRLKNGNLAGIPRSAITLQNTSQADWDALVFNFVINQLAKQDDEGNTDPYSVGVKVTVYDSNGITVIKSVSRSITGKTTTPFKFNIRVNIPEENRSLDGYRFSVEKTSSDTDTSKIADDVQIFGWSEIENSKQAYPRTAVIGYALKAENEHTGGVPSFTSLVKGLLIKVPSNYNQPILSNGDIDWREVEIPTSTRATTGYRLQKTGVGTIFTGSDNPQIYVGTWDGTFVYSWSQNPAWILYDILTNHTYGLGIAEDNIDKFRFYQIAQYCDACDITNGEFIGVSGMADGSFRYKPRNQFTATRQNQVGLPLGTVIEERRFITDLTISEQSATLDLLNSLAGTIRAAIIYTGGKISLAIDMPDEFPVMLFNEANMKEGSFQISGTKENEILTGVDVSYMEPANHFKREVVRIDSSDANDGTDLSVIENIASIDLLGVTRRSQAIRSAQYQIASTKYLRRSVTFTTGTEGVYLSPGDVITVASQGTGIAYGFGGKVIANSTIGANLDTNVTIEHFTVPSLSNSTFTSNTYPLALRIIRMDSDQLDIFLISNTTFELFNTGNVGIGSDTANVQINARYDPITKTIITSETGLTANVAPRKGDLWTLGEWESTDNIYSNKSGKLFKITGIAREPENEEFTISALEYVSNIYVDSDTFINYEPTAYTDIDSSLSVPPPPTINFQAVPRRRFDGSVAVDGVITETTELLGYGQMYKTEYFMSKPDSYTIQSSDVSNVVITVIDEVSYTSGGELTLTVANAGSIVNNTSPASITGKNGFTSSISTIKLLSSSYDIVDTLGGTLSGNIEFSVAGLENCYDPNFSNHVLAVNDGEFFGTLKGADYMSIPVIEKTSTGALLNFVGYNSQITQLSLPIAGYDIANNTIKIENTLNNGLNIVDVLPALPFHITINQLLDSRYYTSNSFFVEGTSYTSSTTGTINFDHPLYNTIQLATKPLGSTFARFFVDGIVKNLGQYTLNINKDLEISANIQYTPTVGDTYYRLEIDNYTAPLIEVGDNVQSSASNVFSIKDSTYDPDAPSYNVAMTANGIYRIETSDRPRANLAGYNFINVSVNPIGIINNVNGSTMTFDYDRDTYAGKFTLANNQGYSLHINSVFEKLDPSNDLIVRDLPYGVTSLKARNRSIMGRTSATVTKTIVVDYLPIQRVVGLTISESLYREQTGGVAVRATCIFDHINGQDITDYEISYKLDNVDAVGTDDGGTDLTSFNTVKVPATGVDTDGKIRFTVYGMNRGITSDTNAIVFRVTPLNKSIRGITAVESKQIIGKTAKPQNIYALTGGQQNDQITLFWKYVTINGDLLDLDLKEVVFRKAPGIVTASVENFIFSDPFLTVSAGSTRKSVPISSYGTYTYLARTKDSSGNLSDDIVVLTLTTTKPQKATTVAAYNEDSPDTQFSVLPINTNAGETNYPSFANSNTGGLAYSYTSAVDNANGTSSGWSTVGGIPTDLLVGGEYGEYTTQIRDFGTVLTGAVLLTLEATQEIQSTYNDQHEEFLESVSEESTNANVLVDVDFGGIGHVLGFANASITTGRYDANNKTWMTGPANGNVWGIWNHGQFVDDVSNANSYALIAGVINANAIALGESFYANGISSGSNAFANVTAGTSTFTLVNFIQFSDTGDLTYAGDLGGVLSQTFIRTSSSADLYYANGNVDVSKFDASSYDNGYTPYETGTKAFRYFQIKIAVNNSKPDEFDFTIDKFRYTIEKEQTVFTTTVLYADSPTVVDYTASAFTSRPTISYSVLNSVNQEVNPPLVITTECNSHAVSFKLINSQGSGEYTANSTANVMITVVGV
jgi:hypothetical protein